MLNLWGGGVYFQFVVYSVVYNKKIQPTFKGNRAGKEFSSKVLVIKLVIGYNRMRFTCKRSQGAFCYPFNV